MRYTKFLFLYIGLTCLQSISMANDGNVINHNALWNEIYFLGRINKYWSWQMELHYRRVSFPNSSEPFNIAALPYQHLYRPWIHYHPNKWLRLSLSPITYAVTFSQKSSNMIKEPEIRFSLQAMSTHVYFNRLIVNHRFRYEYRMIGQRNSSNNEFDYDFNYSFPVYDNHAQYGGVALQRNRFRYMLRAILPLGKNNKIVNNSFYLIGWSEVYINLFKNVPSNQIFDQNRTFLLLGYKIPSVYPVRLELGYGLRIANKFNYQSVHTYTHSTDLMNIMQFYVWFDNVHLFFKKRQLVPTNE